MSMRWYSVSVLSNFEKRVAETIKEAVAQNSLQDEIEQILITKKKRTYPYEDAHHIKRISP